ncbi:MAG: hypothetical protein PHP10_01085 [Candidatus Omnitrophica bacterium]|nr:hypothetical protein [Candidatus Omnitrophota bacterium]
MRKILPERSKDASGANQAIIAGWPKLLWDMANKPVIPNMLLLPIFLTLTPVACFAHEAYVLPREFFWKVMRSPPDPRALDALKKPQDFHIFVTVVAGVSAFLFLNFLFRQTSLGKKLHAGIEKLAPAGPVFVRLAIAAAFFISAASGCFLGTELKLAQLPAGPLVKMLLYACSISIFFGFLTELAGFLSLAVFVTGFTVFGGYMMTYFNYLGEIIVLLFFGLRHWSFDAALFGKLRGWRERLDIYSTTIVRVFYGIALMYAAITVKFLHPDLTVKVVKDWHLTQFHWLFPSDPLLVTLGAALAEAIIGLFIIIGFELRATVIISLFYITLSLMYFREIVWPHFMLYGISLNLIVEPERFTFDHIIFARHRKHWWRHMLGKPVPSGDNASLRKKSQQKQNHQIYTTVNL